MTRRLSVWWDGVVVGTLQVNQHGLMRFSYSADWLADASRPAISFSLPKQEQPFTQRQCRRFFAGLLPEEAQRDVIAGALGISKAPCHQRRRWHRPARTRKVLPSRSKVWPREPWAHVWEWRQALRLGPAALAQGTIRLAVLAHGLP